MNARNLCVFSSDGVFGRHRVHWLTPFATLLWRVLPGRRNLLGCYNLHWYANKFVLTGEIFRVIIGFIEGQEDL
jgi:hypothetical protein